LVQEGNKFAFEGLGSPEVPGLKKSTVGKMGLKGVRGIVVVPDPPRVPRATGGGESRLLGYRNAETRKLNLRIQLCL
jgi:ATP-dependent RNA helicase MSS116